MYLNLVRIFPFFPTQQNIDLDTIKNADTSNSSDLTRDLLRDCRY